MKIKCPEQGATLLRGVFQQPVNAKVVYTIEYADGSSYETKPYFIGPVGDQNGYYGTDIPVFVDGYEFKQGSNYVSSHFIDLAGNSSPESNKVEYYYDTIAPTGTVINNHIYESYESVSLKSTEDGIAYLVLRVNDVETSYTSEYNIRGLDSKLWNEVNVTANNIAYLPLDDLEFGSYFNKFDLYAADEMGNLFNRLLKYLPPCPRRQPQKRSSLIPCHYH